MYLIKANKNKLNEIEYPSFIDVDRAMIDEVNSYYPVLRAFKLDHDEIHWTYEEYNIVLEQTLLEIIEWLKNKIFGWLGIYRPSQQLEQESTIESRLPAETVRKLREIK